MELLKEFKIKERIVVTNPSTVFEHMKEFRDQNKEFTVVFFLDTKNKILLREIVHIGTISSCMMCPRDIFKTAIIKGANSIIIAHNHPSGDPSPSSEDLSATLELKKAGEILQIKVLDHIIAGHDTYYSFRNEDAVVFG